MSDLSLILLVLLVCIALGIAPIWPHSTTWGYGPTGGVALLLVILLVLVMLGRI